ncbi:hypothetical protein [Pseudonocardia sp. Ae707_Ps2]|uniref:hypothetical protein n=1 Tax=Pseudonocardia sp. Ae707_Ps2 TaxID=2212992 RepID=UPI00307EE147
MYENSMCGPGEHEHSAVGALADGEVEKAEVVALLAIASTVNRAAAALEKLAATGELSDPPQTRGHRR